MNTLEHTKHVLYPDGIAPTFVCSNWPSKVSDAPEEDKNAMTGKYQILFII